MKRAPSLRPSLLQTFHASKCFPNKRQLGKFQPLFRVPETERRGAGGAAPLARQVGRDGQKRDNETGGENENHAAPPKAPRGEKPQPDGTATPDGRATKHGTPEPAAKAREAQEPEPAPQKHAAERDDGARPGGHGAEGNEKSGAPTPPSARTNATERAAKEPRDTPAGPAKDATENTRNRDGATDARTAASTPDAQPTNTRDEGARAAKHGARDAGATEREPENPTTGAPDKAATTEEGKEDEEEATAGTQPQPPARTGGRRGAFRLRMKARDDRPATGRASPGAREARALAEGPRWAGGACAERGA